jgi:D-arginine dehydrogenase
MTDADVLVIGGGIAGVSAGHHLAASGRNVLLVEAESALARHTTGRSAALFFENYGAGPVRPLTRASRPFLTDPPPELVDVPLLSPRGALTIARPDQADHLARVTEEGVRMGADVRPLTPSEAGAIVPELRIHLLAGALWEPGAADMDVAAIHQAFVRGMRRAGAEIRTSAPVTALEPVDGGGWRAMCGGEEVHADVVVDAAGAWCDVVAGLAGVRPVGLVPKRRTAFMVPSREEWRLWPLVVDVDHDFYFKPDGVQLLCSLAEETPSEPCDARPEEIDVALAIDRINEATTIGIRSVRSAWAGLRSFVADGAMVIGFDPDAPGFFWLAGQGGTGIQTAPGAGRLAAALVVDGEAPADMVDLGLDPTALAPDRLR